MKCQDLPLLLLTTKDVEKKDQKYKTEKYELGNVLKALKNDYDCYRKNYKCLNRKKSRLIFSEI